MKKCANCGNQIEEEAHFCDACGSKVEEQQEQPQEPEIIEINQQNDEPANSKSSIQPEDPEAKRRKYWLIGSIGSVLVMVILMMPILFSRISGVDQSKMEASNNAQSVESSQSVTTSTQSSGSDPVRPTDSQTANVTTANNNSTTNSGTTSKTVQEAKTGYNDTGIHHYEYILSDSGWSEAFAKAKAKGGYLAHINSPEEFAYITRELENKGYQKMEFYIGGRRDSASQSYYWVDENNKPYGEVLNASLGSWFWLKNEPSFMDGSIEEAYLNILYYKAESKWVGNDGPENIVVCLPEFSGKTGFIIEYE